MSELWTTAELKHYYATGEEPNAVTAKKAAKPKAKKTAVAGLAGEAPLSVEVAWNIYKVKAALARDANVAADVALTVYRALSDKAPRRAEPEKRGEEEDGG